MSLRVMWLLNHTSARKFEVPMLKRCGVSQIYLPKRVPNDVSFRSGSVSYEEDAGLDIPPHELEVLNSCDWYAGATAEAWSIANRYFDVAFIILYDEELFKKIARYFKGAVLYRAYGLLKPLTYSDLIRHFRLEPYIRNIYPRFYFAEAYSHLANIEERYVSNRRLYLPLGMAKRTTMPWQGTRERIYFVCPGVGYNDYYKEVYRRFKEDFAEFDFVVAGEQMIPVNDSRVLGFVPEEAHHANMSQSRVMFYHSQEPNHIHYHPFEAVSAGMPLVFMAGGMLDRFGGKDLPGRATSVNDARRLIRRLMKGDQALIERIRTSQQVLLKAMDAEALAPAWQAGLARIKTDLEVLKQAEHSQPWPKRNKRIAVILPEAYRGGTLRGALMVAQAIHAGSRRCSEPAEVVFAYREDTDIYSDEDFADLDADIARRAFRWRRLSISEVHQAMHFAGHEGRYAETPHIVPDDGMRQFMDCDLWLFISDRLTAPLLPIRPTVMMVYDYLQRYENVMPGSVDQLFLRAARSADKVLVTTQFTLQDALQYAGVDPKRLVQVPMLIPIFSQEAIGTNKTSEPYFLWTTNAAPHKNHVEVIKALRLYYEEYNGVLACRVTGVGTMEIPGSKLRHLRPLENLLKQSALLRSRICWCGDLPEREYRAQLKGAEFLMHAARIDNGTFSVIEAAQLGVPSLSTDYPAMREMDQRFSLNLTWMDGGSARHMAKMIKQMEETCQSLRPSLPAAETFRSHDVTAHAQLYWQEVRKCL